MIITFPTLWKDLYKIGGIFSIIMIAFLVIGVLVFLIFPFVLPGTSSIENIFISIQSNLLRGLITLDLLALLGGIIYILPWLALYIALRRVNESYALIAVVLGLIALTIIIPAKPIYEIVLLSEQYSKATTDVEKSQYLAAGEAFHTLYTGTSWIVFNVLINLSGLIYSLLMIRSKIFNKKTAYLGIILFSLGFGIFIPVIGIPLAGLATICIGIWYITVARVFFRLARK